MSDRTLVLAGASFLAKQELAAAWKLEGSVGEIVLYNGPRKIIYDYNKQIRIFILPIITYLYIKNFSFLQFHIEMAKQTNIHASRDALS